jgi:DNA-directed RNA polymerase subunit RPC12/RpoP
MLTGYCLYEKKANRQIMHPRAITLKNGEPAIQGTCGSCGKLIFRLGKLKSEEPEETPFPSVLSPTLAIKEVTKSHDILSGSVANPFPNLPSLAEDEPIRLTAQCQIFTGSSFRGATLVMTDQHLFLVLNADKEVRGPFPLSLLSVGVERNMLVGKNLRDVLKLVVTNTAFLLDILASTPTNLAAEDIVGAILAAKKHVEEQTKLAKSPQANDFKWLKELIDKGGVVVTAVKCPSCGGIVDIPKEGNFVKCEHCSQTLYVEDVVGIIKKLGAMR